MTKILFLPGSGASPDFWKPVGSLLPADWPKVYFGWPGLGRQPHDPAVRGIDDLIAMVVAKMEAPVDLVAQSMGGVIAARIALAHPQLVRRLVLTVTSGGVEMAAFGASDWRADYRKSFSERRRMDLRAAHRGAAAGRAHHRADAADLGRFRSDQPCRGRPASRAAHSRRAPAHRRRRQSRRGQDLRQDGRGAGCRAPQPLTRRRGLGGARRRVLAASGQ